MDRLLLDRLRTLVTFEIDSFENQLGKLQSSHYPSNNSLEFIASLSDELQTQRNEISQIISDFPEDPERVARGLRSQHRLVIEKLSHLGSLEKAQTQEVPWSVVPSVERLASQLIPGKRLLTACTHTFNYGIRWYPFPKSAVQEFLILELPALHKTNPFLHIVVGHELFHPLLADFFRNAAPLVMARLRGSCESHLRGSPASKGTLAKQRLDQVVELARYIWQRALEELMCDMGCAVLFGPAAILAAFTFASGSSLDEPPSPEGQFYAPWRFRFRQVLHYVFDDWNADEERGPLAQTPGNNENQLTRLHSSLKAGGFAWAADALEQWFRVLGTEVAKKTDLRGIESDPLLKIVYKEVDESLPKAWGYVRDRAVSVSGSWVSAIDEVAALLKNLSLLVPPGEIRATKVERDDCGSKLNTRPPSLSSLAIASWLQHLRDQELRADASAEKFLEKYHRLCGLMLKAFEDVELSIAYCSRDKTKREAKADGEVDSHECPHA